jgi:hypothetical protein
MPKVMRLLHERGPANPGMAVDADGAMLGPDCVLVRRTPQGYRCIDDEEAATLQACLFGDRRDSDWLSGRCRRIAKALDNDDVPLAQIFGIYIGIGDLDAERLKRLALAAPLIKANFDPGEARIPSGQPGGGQWTTGGDGNDTSIADASRDGNVHLVVSNDAFHDAVEDYMVRAFRANGLIAEQQVSITSIGSEITAVPDILAMSPSGFVFAIDVKTGKDPGLTMSQRYVYALMDVGRHVYSSDDEISSFGFSPEQPLPPICVYFAYAEAPGSEIKIKTYSTNPECFSRQDGALAKRGSGPLDSQEVAMSDPVPGPQLVQQLLIGDMVKNGDTAVALVEVLVRNLYGVSSLQEQQPFVARDGGRVWIVEGSLNKDRSVEGGGKLVATVNKLDAKIGTFMFDYVMFPPTEPPSGK